MNKKNISILILSITFFIFVSSALSFVFAQNNSSLSLTVFPAIQDITILPGERTRGQIQLRNASDNVVTGQLKVGDFIVKDQTGTPILIDPAQTPSKYSAASWFSLNQAYIAIPPKDFVTVDFTINPPQEIATCSRHSIIYFEQNTQNPSISNPQQPESVSQTTAQLGALINLLVENKQCKENLSLVKPKMPTFLEYGPIPISFSIVNLSDFFIEPQGSITLLNMFNKIVDQKTLSQQRIFPEALKEYSDSLGQKLMVGRYKILVKAATNGKNSVAKELVIYSWVLPWKIVAVIFFAFLIIFFTIRGFVKKTLTKEKELEEELKAEKQEIEKLKEALKNKEE